MEIENFLIKKILKKEDLNKNEIKYIEEYKGEIV